MEGAFSFGALAYLAWQCVQRNVLAARQFVQLLTRLRGEEFGNRFVRAALVHVRGSLFRQARSFAQTCGKVRL